MPDFDADDAAADGQPAGIDTSSRSAKKSLYWAMKRRGTDKEKASDAAFIALFPLEEVQKHDPTYSRDADPAPVETEPAEAEVAPEAVEEPVSAPDAVEPAPDAAPEPEAVTSEPEASEEEKVEASPTELEPAPLVPPASSAPTFPVLTLTLPPALTPTQQAVLATGLPRGGD